MGDDESKSVGSRPVLVPNQPLSGDGHALTQEEKRIGKTLKKSVRLSEDELADINSKKGLLQLLSTKNVDVEKALIKLRYEQELERLQIEFVKLQRSV